MLRRDAKIFPSLWEGLGEPEGELIFFVLVGSVDVALKEKT